MKETVKRACGHEETIQVYGSVKDREYTIHKEEKKLCVHCLAEEQKKQYENCDMVEVPYREYKEKYSECVTLTGSYNPDTKTIVVFIPNKKEAEKEISEIVAAAMAELGCDIDTSSIITISVNGKGNLTGKEMATNKLNQLQRMFTPPEKEPEKQRLINMYQQIVDILNKYGIR